MDPITSYKSASKKLILLDYDGTLVNFASTPERAKPTVQLLNVLYRLACRPSTRITIITGREYRSIDDQIGYLPIDIAAEHGAMLKTNGIWKDLANGENTWKKEILPLMEEITSKSIGSFIEEKRFSLSWHYRNIDWLSGHIWSRELIHRVQNARAASGLKILDANKTVEIMPKEISKGKIAKDLLGRDTYDYVLSIGDDQADEDVFRALSGNKKYFTVKVGHGHTIARYRVDSSSQVIQLLEQI